MGESTGGTKATEFFPGLESLRSICALTVAVFHVPWANHLLLSSVMDRAWTFVDFFFVLSGFVISNAYMDKIVNAGAAKAFMIKRLFRLYPLHFVMLVAVGILQYIGWKYMGKADPFGSNWPTLLFLNLTLSHAVGFSSPTMLNVVSWSISVEFYAYLTFAGLCLLVRNQSLRWIAIGTGVLLALYTLLFANNNWGLIEMPTASLARGYYGFGLGCLVTLARQKFRHSGTGLFADLMLLANAIAIGAIMSRSAMHDNALLWLPPLFALIIFMIATVRDSWLVSVLETRRLRRLGEISYSIYLTQTIYLMIFSLLARRIVDNAMDNSSYRHPVLAVPLWTGDLLVLAYSAALIAGSWFTYRWIEAPGRRLGRHLAG